MAGKNGIGLTRKDLVLMTAKPTEPPLYKVGPGRSVRYSRSDAIPQYVTDSPTAAKFVSLLKGVDFGEAGDMFRLFEEMQSKDAHLQGVSNTRANAITALEWSVGPAIVPTEQQTLANEAAEYVSDELLKLRSFNDTLVHLTEAISTGASVVELVWKDFRLAKTINVPGQRLRQDLATGRLKVETEKKPLGIELPPGKFVVYIPKPKAGFPFKVTLTRAAAWLYLVKHFVFADWAGFSERFGMPIPVGTIGDNVDPGAADKLATALSKLMAEGYAVLPEGCGIDLKEAARGTQPFGELMELIDKKVSILWLGQTLTTEMQSVGSFAAANVHNNVRTDILLSDLRQEAAMVQYQIIAPMVYLRFPGKQIPLPRFVRQLIESRNIESERLTMDQIDKAERYKMPIDKEWLYDALSIPKPTDPKTTIVLGGDTEVSQQEEPVTSGGVPNV